MTWCHLHGPRSGFSPPFCVSTSSHSAAINREKQHYSSATEDPCRKYNFISMWPYAVQRSTFGFMNKRSPWWGVIEPNSTLDSKLNLSHLSTSPLLFCIRLCERVELNLILTDVCLLACVWFAGCRLHSHACGGCYQDAGVEQRGETRALLHAGHSDLKKGKSSRKAWNSTGTQFRPAWISFSPSGMWIWWCKTMWFL